MTAPTVDPDEMHADFDRLAVAHREGSEARRVVTGRIIDGLLDRWNERHGLVDQ